MGHNLSRTAAEKIFNYAYNDKHAYGFHEVRWELERLVELVSEIMTEQKKPQRNKKMAKRISGGRTCHDQIQPNFRPYINE